MIVLPVTMATLPASLLAPARRAISFIHRALDYARSLAISFDRYPVFYSYYIQTTLYRTRGPFEALQDLHVDPCGFGIERTGSLQQMETRLAWGV